MAASSSVSSIHASPWMALPLPPAAARTSCQTLMWPHSSELQASFGGAALRGMAARGEGLALCTQPTQCAWSDVVAALWGLCARWGRQE